MYIVTCRVTCTCPYYIVGHNRDIAQIRACLYNALTHKRVGWGIKKKPANYAGFLLKTNISVTHMSHSGLKYLFLKACRRAHNPKVGGSNPSPATRGRPSVIKQISGGFRYSGRLFQTFFHCSLVQFWLIETILFSHVLVIVNFKNKRIDNPNLILMDVCKFYIK